MSVLCPYCLDRWYTPGPRARDLQLIDHFFVRHAGVLSRLRNDMAIRRNDQAEAGL